MKKLTYFFIFFSSSNAYGMEMDYQKSITIASYDAMNWSIEEKTIKEFSFFQNESSQSTPLIALNDKLHELKKFKITVMNIDHYHLIPFFLHHIHLYNGVDCLLSKVDHDELYSRYQLIILEDFYDLIAHVLETKTPYLAYTLFDILSRYRWRYNPIDLKPELLELKKQYLEAIHTCLHNYTIIRHNQVTQPQATIPHETNFFCKSTKLADAALAQALNYFDSIHNLNAPIFHKTDDKSFMPSQQQPYHQNIFNFPHDPFIARPFHHKDATPN